MTNNIQRIIIITIIYKRLKGFLSSPIAFLLITFAYSFSTIKYFTVLKEIPSPLTFISTMYFPGFNSLF